MWITGGLGQSASTLSALGGADYDEAIVLFSPTFCSWHTGIEAERGIHLFASFNS